MLNIFEHSDWTVDSYTSCTGNTSDWSCDIKPAVVNEKARCFVIFFFFARTTEAAQVTLLNPVDSMEKSVCTFIYNHGDRVTLFFQFVKKKSGILFGRITWFFQYTYRRDVFFNLFCIKNSLFMVQYFAEFGWSANVNRRFSWKSSCFIPAIRLTHSDSVRTV